MENFRKTFKGEIERNFNEIMLRKHCILYYKTQPRYLGFFIYLLRLLVGHSL